MERKFDVIIFGASGYTGKYAVRKAVEILNGMQWAVAGRNKAKIEETLRDSGKKVNADLSKIPIIIADVADDKSLAEMAKQAKVIVNVCGPYHLWGEAVVKACIENGANHVDITGEPQFIDKIQLKYDQKAREKGLYIISACGLESIPGEMGISYIQKNFNGTVNSIESYLGMSFEKGYDPKGPLLNFGTYHSAVLAFSQFFESQKIRKILYPKSMPRFKPQLKNRLAHREEAVGNGWCLPLIEPDQSMVRKTQRYFYEKEELRPIQFNAYMVFKSFFDVLCILLFAPIVLLLAQFEFGQKLLLAFPKLFLRGVTSHDGPDEETVEKTEFEMIFIARGWKEQLDNSMKDQKTPMNKKMITRVSGKNPAYGATSVALLLSATTIIKESAKLPEGGVLTPGIAFKKTNLIQELVKHGYTFEIVSDE
jgi:short subunit dehydrogenase-like uncharacterized protein